MNWMVKRTNNYSEDFNRKSLLNINRLFRFLNYLNLEFSILRRAWERYHVADIGHAGNE